MSCLAKESCTPSIAHIGLNLSTVVWEEENIFWYFILQEKKDIYLYIYFLEHLRAKSQIFFCIGLYI
jgi:hypothetical protein